VVVMRVINHFKANRLDGERFRDYVVRHKVEFFRNMVSDVAKPETFDAEYFKDWGDESGYSLQLGRGECAS
jgi:hypothetical protein